jgi:hypothetical protein
VVGTRQDDRQTKNGGGGEDFAERHSDERLCGECIVLEVESIVYQQYTYYVTFFLNSLRIGFAKYFFQTTSFEINDY